MSREQFLWVEKYRPKTISECILPKDIKSTFQEFVDNKEIPNLLLSGSAGSGKTTVARALCNELEADYILINGSEESGIDVLRNKIKNFASTVSLSGGIKVVILDEADYLNPNSTQPALRGFIEEFSNNCRFILTCNFKNRLIDPIHSRTSVIDFQVSKKNQPELMGQFMNRLITILDVEQIQIENKAVLAEMIKKHFPDYRRMLNELQRHSSSGIIDAGVLSQISNANIDSLIGNLKKKQFTDMRKWVALNIDNDPISIIRKIYDGMYDFLKPESIPQTVLILADYQYKAAFVADQEINLVSCLTEIMMESEFK
jgi:DNA polymerase III delta prime subunit